MRIESSGEDSTYCAGNAEPRWRQKESERERDPRLLPKDTRRRGRGQDLIPGQEPRQSLPFTSDPARCLQAGWRRGLNKAKNSGRNALALQALTIGAAQFLNSRPLPPPS